MSSDKFWISKCDVKKRVFPRANRKNPMGDTLTEIDDNTISEGWGSNFASAEEKDYHRVIERRGVDVRHEAKRNPDAYGLGADYK